MEQHIAQCARCAAERVAVTRVVACYRALPWDDASPSRVEEQRTALIARAALAKPAAVRRRAWWTVPVIAAAVALLVVWSATAPKAAFHGALTPHRDTSFYWISSRPDERVVLITGTLSVDVSPLERGERFRIATSDAEVEVRGTAFEITADHGRLVSVHVWHGRVEVRPRDGANVILGGGAAWAAPVIVAHIPSSVVLGALPGAARDSGSAPASAPSVELRSPSRRGPHRVSSGPPAASEKAHPNPGTLAYQEAWSALRAGDHTSAANGFEHAATIAPLSALAEDAWYWRAVSLARAGDAPSARASFAAFLEHYRGSPRAPQASAMLGWLLFDAGDLDGAEARFHTAAGDLAPAVRDSAVEGLEAVRRRRSVR